ncbi:hypothetical protein STEG23_000108, partial [Scotinomys teguina]
MPSQATTQRSRGSYEISGLQIPKQQRATVVICLWRENEGLQPAVPLGTQAEYKSNTPWVRKALSSTLDPEQSIPWASNADSSLLSQGTAEELECDSWKGLQSQFYPLAQDEIITLNQFMAQATRHKPCSFPALVLSQGPADSCKYLFNWNVVHDLFMLPFLHIANPPTQRCCFSGRGLDAPSSIGHPPLRFIANHENTLSNMPTSQSNGENNEGPYLSIPFAKENLQMANEPGFGLNDPRINSTLFYEVKYILSDMSDPTWSFKRNSNICLHKDQCRVHSSLYTTRRNTETDEMSFSQGQDKDTAGLDHSNHVAWSSGTSELPFYQSYCNHSHDSK